MGIFDFVWKYLALTLPCYKVLSRTDLLTGKHFLDGFIAVWFIIIYMLYTYHICFLCWQFYSNRSV